MDDRILDDMDDNLSELQEFFTSLYSRWSEALVVGRKRRGPAPSENKFWQYLHQHPAAGSTWITGSRRKMSLLKCVELAIRFYEIGQTGGIFGWREAERLYEINGYDPVMPVRDPKLRQLALDIWDKLDYAEQEDLVNYAERLHSGDRDNPAPTTTEILGTAKRNIRGSAADEVAETLAGTGSQ